MPFKLYVHHRIIRSKDTKELSNVVQQHRLDKTLEGVRKIGSKLL
jgi:hypothetical protein